VNTSGADATKLKAVMEKVKLNWRSFADPGDLGQGAIATRWNATVTPTLYILDHEGTIRHKWVGAPGARVIDAALEKLLEKAEGSGKR
jgi:hypothetical protein